MIVEEYSKNSLNATGGRNGKNSFTSKSPIIHHSIFWHDNFWWTWKNFRPSSIFNTRKPSKLVRNLLKAKVLLGFLPKVQDSGIKTTENFRILQREVFHKCFSIMLRPLLEKSDALYFGVKGQAMQFAARISLFLSDMLDSDEIMATYKSARSKGCIILAWSRRMTLTTWTLF